MRCTVLLLSLMILVALCEAEHGRLYKRELGDDYVLKRYPRNIFKKLFEAIKKKSIESRENEFEAEGLLLQSGKRVLAENLRLLGFNKETSEIITQHIPDKFVDLQKPSFWSVRYLNHAYRHHPLLSSTPRFLHGQHLVDQWFEIKLLLYSAGTDFEVAKLGLSEIRYAVPIENGFFGEKVCLGEIHGSYDKIDYVAAQLVSIEVDSDIAKLSLTETNSDDANLCAVRMINISSDKSHGNVLVEKFLKALKSDENCLLFHGTIHENVMSVVASGIILTRGSKKQDFSNGDGFYLSDKSLIYL